MKKLSLLMSAILILGCGTETTVVNEPPTIIKEPPTIIEEPPPVVMDEEPIGHSLVARGSVKHGEVNVDPELPVLHFELTEPFLRYRAVLREKDGYALAWDDPGAARTNLLSIQEMREDPLQYDTEYVLEIFALNYDCEVTVIVIQFRTKPQRPAVGQPEPVIQAPIPVVPSGEHFRRDIDFPAIVAGDVADGANNVDPEPLNANGIHFEFDEAIKTYKIDLRLHEGATLGWLPRGLVDNNMEERIHIMPAEGFPLLEFDTAYQIDIFVEDFGCWTEEFTIVFRTKPKP